MSWKIGILEKTSIRIYERLEKEMATHSCSCLENPRDGGAWWAAVYGVAQSRTQLKRLSSSSSSKRVQRDTLPLLPSEDIVKSWHLRSRKWTSGDTKSAGALILDKPAYRTVKNKCLLLIR